jgi:hypothetical protein
VLTLYTTPVIYLYFDRFRLWCQRMWPVIGFYFERFLLWCGRIWRGRAGPSIQPTE